MEASLFTIALNNIKYLGVTLSKQVENLYDKKFKSLGAGEMAQWLRALPVLPKVLSSIPGNHMVAHNHL